MSGLSFNPLLLDFSSGCLHGSAHGRHVFLLAAAGVIRPQDVSAHGLSLDFLLKHGHRMLDVAQHQIRCWHQWQALLVTGAATSMRLDCRPEEVASYSHLLQVGHVQDLWSAYVADPYAAHLDLVDVIAKDLSCI